MNHFFKDFSLKKKLYIIIISAFVISVIFTSVFAGISFYRASKSFAYTFTIQLNSNFSNRIKNEIQKNVETTRLLSNVLSQFQYTNANDYLQKPLDIIKASLKLYPEIKTILLNFPVKTISDSINSTPTSYHLKSVQIEKDETGIIKIFDTGEDYLDLISQNKSSIKEMVSVSEPFKSKAGNLSGYALLFTSPLNIKPLDINASVSIIVSCDNVIKLIDQSVSGKNSSSLLVTSTNSIIGVSAKHWMTGKNIIKFQGEEHEIFTQLKSINQNVFQYKDKVISNHEIKVEHSNISWNLISSIPISNSITRFNQTIIYIVIALMLLLLSGLVIILFLLKNALIPFKLIIESAKKIGNGELITISKGNFEHEFNEIINGINNITENLKEVTQVSAEIAQGNIESKIKIKSENDILSISVNKIADNLKQSILDREAQADLTNKQLWMRRGRFEVAEAERMSSEKQDDLAFNLIRSIVNYCDASMGGVYTYDSETEKIILIAAYAYGNKKMIKKEFIKGEGLVGTCVLEKKKIELTKIPDDYLKITTGLGSGTPGYLIIIPVFFQEKINSVLEIAFNRKPENHIVEFIEQVCESIGGWLDASAKKNKTIELLQISREQTKQLAEKEAELNTKINELQLIQNQIAIKNAEYQSILKAVNHSVMTVNYTPEGVLLDANEVYLGIMGYTLDELKGMNVFDLVKDQEKDLKTIIERVMIGETIHKQVKRYTKEGAEKWLSATYTPFVNADNLITGVLFFAVEINNVIFDKQAG